VDVRRLAIATTVVLPLVLMAACGGPAKSSLMPGKHSATSYVPSTTSASTSTATSSTEPVPALQTHNPTVTVAPATGLFDNQDVLVTVTGFGIGGKVWLSECASISDANDAGCGQQLPEQPFLGTDDSGTGTIAFQLQSSASAQRYNLVDLVPCVDNCVVVATVGIGFGFASSATLHFVGSAPPNCTTAQLHISAGMLGGATGHTAIPLLFTNTGSQECRLSGYPGVAGLDGDGRQVTQAQRQPNGFIGGLHDYSGGPLPAIGLSSGETGSALIEGQDNPPDGATPCAVFAGVLVTPPNATQSVRIDVGVPGCSDFQVHPVVLGTTGQG